jgi:hypothetical protein
MICLLVQPLLICSCSFMRPQGATFSLTFIGAFGFKPNVI